MHGHSFGAPQATAVKVITVVACILLCVPVYIFTLLPAGATWLGALMIGGPVFVVFGCAGYMIRGYRLSGHALCIRRLGWETRLDLIRLTSVTYDVAAMSRSFRIVGNSGFFAVTGWFWNRKLGRYRAYVTDPKRAVVLRFDDRVVVVSPDRPAEFVAAVSETRGRQPGRV